jgi:hypothetical protein
MNVSRIRITRDHLKKIRKLHMYDGIWKYKKSKNNPELESLTVMVMFDIYKNLKK